MKLRGYFKDVPEGSSCIGTIHLYRLDPKPLIRDGIVKEIEDGDGHVIDYQFRGFNRYPEHSYPEWLDDATDDEAA